MARLLRADARHMESTVTLVLRGLRLAGPVAVPTLLGVLHALRGTGASSQVTYLALLVGAFLVLRPTALAILTLCTVLAMLAPMAYVDRPPAVLASCLMTLALAAGAAMVVRPLRAVLRDHARRRLAETSRFAVEHGSANGAPSHGTLADAAVRQLQRGR